MKNILFLLLAIVLCVGCETIEDNSPALQGTIDHDLFKANDVRAEKYDNGSVTIQGYSREETLTLHINGFQLGTYELGEGRSSYASFVDENGNNYITTTPSGSGKIVVANRCISCGWLSGTFNFEAILPNVDTITVHRGVFHKANFLEGGIIGGGNNNDEYLIAKINGEYFEANTLNGEIIDEKIVIIGAVGDTRIILELPINTPTGNNLLPNTNGYTAFYVDESGVEEEANSGNIRVNHHNIGIRYLRIGFNFSTDNNEIVNGVTEVYY
jgi:hypothetical protein